jgi:nucleoside-diphosphate kinase
MAVERTLFIVKPDAVVRGLTGKILAHVETQGFRLVEARLGRISADEAKEFYAEHAAKPFFGDLVQYMTSGPVMLTCLEKEAGVAALREVVGATDPAQAAPGTIRKLYGESKQMNSVHASDSVPSAERELSIFFGRTAASR